jgi:hypothetical protein
VVESSKGKTQAAEAGFLPELAKELPTSAYGGASCHVPTFAIHFVTLASLNFLPSKAQGSKANVAMFWVDTPAGKDLLGIREKIEKWIRNLAPLDPYSWP